MVSNICSSPLYPPLLSLAPHSHSFISQPFVQGMAPGTCFFYGGTYFGDSVCSNGIDGVHGMHKGPGWVAKRRFRQFLKDHGVSSPQRIDVFRSQMRPGWIEQYDLDNRLLFYHHAGSGITQWDFPCASCVDAQSLKRPPPPSTCAAARTPSYLPI